MPLAAGFAETFAISSRGRADKCICQSPGSPTLALKFVSKFIAIINLNRLSCLTITQTERYSIALLYSSIFNYMEW